MGSFNFNDYLYLNPNQLLKIKLRERDEWIFVSSVSRSVLQGFQPAFTPILKINLKIVKDLALHKQDKNDYENYYEISVEPEEVEEFELLEL